MICATCGKNNADHLVFCEDCGARLQPRVVPPTPPIGIPMQPALPEGRKCARCGAMNAVGMRFCITCGSPLDRGSQPAAPLPPPVPAASPIAPAASPAPVAPVPAPAPAAMIAPAPVVGLGAPVAATETQICKRCQGASEKGAQFCRFCGAPLGEPPAAVVQASKATLPSAQSGAAPAPARLDSTLVTSAPRMESAPAPAPAPSARLVVVHKDGGEGASFPLVTQLDIGRSEGGATFADDRYMAPRHARVTYDAGKVTVRDLGTTNGVYIRLRKEPNAIVIEDQDLILLGQQVLRFEIVKDADAGFGAASEQGTLVFGTPAGPRYARLCQRTTEGVACDVFHVRKAETVLGRESGDIVFPDDPFLSRRHAAITCSAADAAMVTRSAADAAMVTRSAADAPHKFTLSDLGSSNGTFIRARGEIVLQHGDEIRVGQQLLRVDLGGRAPGSAVKGSS